MGTLLECPGDIHQGAMPKENLGDNLTAGRRQGPMTGDHVPSLGEGGCARAGNLESDQRRSWLYPTLAV
jgi:hypothetical protein